MRMLAMKEESVDRANAFLKEQGGTNQYYGIEKIVAVARVSDALKR